MGPFGLIIYGYARKWSAKVNENAEICKCGKVQIYFIPCQVLFWG